MIMEQKIKVMIQNVAVAVENVLQDAHQQSNAAGIALAKVCILCDHANQCFIKNVHIIQHFFIQCQDCIRVNVNALWCVFVMCRMWGLCRDW